jgi:hypothetical protein
MCEFAAKRLVARSSWLFEWVVRCASWVVPLGVLIDRDLWAALSAALFLGIADGYVRLMTSRTARSLVAESEGLLISSAFQTSRIPWPQVLAVQTWSRPGGVEHVAVHYRSAAGGGVATCWEQHEHAELVDFIKACGARVNSESERQVITVLGLHERAVWAPLARRALLDVGVAACFALVLGPALLLGVITAGVSAVIACSRYPLWTTRFFLKDGLWCRETKRGVKRLSTVPRRLRMWVDALGDSRAHI